MLFPLISDVLVQIFTAPSVQCNSFNFSENIGFSLTTVAVFRVLDVILAAKQGPAGSVAVILRVNGDSGLVDNTSGVVGLADFRW